MEVDKIEAFNYMLHPFRLNIVVLNQEKVRNHITQKDIMTNFITE